MSEQKQQPIISIDHVSMRFNLAKEKHESLKEYFVALLHGGVRFDEFFALSDVSFDIMPGDFYGLIGLNGSGKSTLLKVISGVYKPSAGKVTVNGTIAPLIELGAGFDMDLTARENIYLNGTVLGYTPKYIDSKFGRIVRHTTGSHNDCPSQIIIVNGEVFPEHIRSHTVSHHKIRNTRIFFLDHRAQCMHVCDHRVTRIFRKISPVIFGCYGIPMS